MKLQKQIKLVTGFAHPHRVTGSKKFRLKDFDPSDTGDLTSEDKPKAQESLRHGIEALAALQDRLYAQDRWGLLVILQAMDAAGKDSVIKHVMSGINPQGCQVTSFKAPSSQELDHDFLWRCNKALPARGQIGIFNRSYYEEVLVVRVHPEFLEREKLPPGLVTKHIWKERYHDFRAFEQYLHRNGIVVRKFFLHISRQEQKRRFLERIENPCKNWKFSASDLVERAYWKDYMSAYEEMIRHTATQESPWYVVPADNKWYTRIVVAAAVIEALDSLDLRYPEITDEQRKLLSRARRTLLAEK